MIQTASSTHLILMGLGLIALEVFILLFASYGPLPSKSDDGLGWFIFLIYIGAPTLLIFKTLWEIFEELIYRVSGIYLSDIGKFSILAIWVIWLLFILCGTVAFMYYRFKDIIKEIQAKAYKEAAKDIISFLFIISCFIAHGIFTYFIGEDYLPSVLVLTVFLLLMGWILYIIWGLILPTAIKNWFKSLLDNSFLIPIKTAIWIYFITAFISFIAITVGVHLISGEF